MEDDIKIDETMIAYNLMRKYSKRFIDYCIKNDKDAKYFLIGTLIANKNGNTTFEECNRLLKKIKKIEIEHLKEFKIRTWKKKKK